MTKHPHDEFDDVAPYPPGRAGAHRAPTEAPGAKRTGLPWIIMLAVIALAVGVVSYFVLPQVGDGDDDPAAGEDTAETEHEQDAAEDGDEAEDGDAATEEEDGESPSPEESPSPTDEDDDDGDTASDGESPVQVLNYQTSAEAAQNAQSQLEEAGYNVTNVTEWTYAATDAPVVFHPSGQGELAQEIASNLGIDGVVEDDRWSSIAVVVDEGFVD
ncbi:MAG: LytR C-terminal domain-containing protein [Nesterenkonia sp.]|nr:LytR C-terminal domain-containing protein [Nesterenkonia sp.]